MQKLIYLILGGIVGTLSRYGLTLFSTKIWGNVLPWGTFIVNSLGCFIAGLLAALAETKIQLTLEQRILLFTGFCGAFTTFSAMIIETDYLYRNNNFIFPLLNILLNTIVGFGLFRLGLMIGK